ncbi:MAG: hypothetical protein IJE67_04885 [Peptococcaceae bacterium]|nr:hypothetical protein [Peptococcaceae bacterium]
MLLKVMLILSHIYLWTWFIWPFVLLYSLAYGIKGIVQNNEVDYRFWILASISLMIILSAIVVPAWDFSWNNVL